MRSGAIDVLVIDSVAALTPRAEIEGEMGDSQPGLQARLMSQALRKLTASISRSNTMVIFINQIRMKIGVMYGSPETTTGGNALKFYASVRLDIRRIGAIKDREEVVGNQTRVKVVKNKVAPPFKQVEFDIMYGEGISKIGELIDLGVKAGVVEKSGAWFSFDSQRLGQGRENAKAYLKANPEIAGRIEKAIRENAGLIAERILDNVDPAEARRRRRLSASSFGCAASPLTRRALPPRRRPASRGERAAAPSLEQSAAASARQSGRRASRPAERRREPGGDRRRRAVDRFVLAPSLPSRARSSALGDDESARRARGLRKQSSTTSARSDSRPGIDEPRSATTSASAFAPSPDSRPAAPRRRGLAVSPAYALERKRERSQFGAKARAFMSGVNEIRSTFLAVLRQERPRDRAVELARAAQRSDADVHQRRHGAVQERLHRRRAAALPSRRHRAEMRARRRQAQRPRQRRLHRAPPHLLRDARQLLVRRLFQAAAIELAWNLITKRIRPAPRTG